MRDLSVKRTLVKSPPELWSELSEVERLAKHLDAFGEIKITRLEPESTVAWEGEGASGTVSIEPSGWGTKVTLTARVEGEDPNPPEPEHQEPDPISPLGDPDETPHVAKAGWWSRLFGRRRASLVAAADAPVWVTGAAQPAQPEPEPEPEPEPDPHAASHTEPRHESSPERARLARERTRRRPPRRPG
jgi:hypothetical protein